MSEPDPPTRRRRRRATAGQGPPGVGPRGSPAGGAAPDEPARPAAQHPAADELRPLQRKHRRPRDRPDHDLAGAGMSQLGPLGAMRARDVNRPDEDDLAAAEAELTIVRRRWQPPTTTER